MNIAIIITGDVRECFVKNKIVNLFKDYDVFCGSYINHKEYVSKLGKNNYSFLINPETDIRLPNGIKKEQMQQNMLQWLHMDNIIKKYKDKLIKYDVILKYRFDYFKKNNNFLSKIYVEPNVLFCHCDLIFYSNSITFLKIFSLYYDNLSKYTYDNKFQFNNILKNSWRSEDCLKIYLNKINVTRKVLQFQNGTIIRGKYKKTYADGNKKLYDEDENLLGKFTDK